MPKQKRENKIKQDLIQRQKLIQQADNARVLLNYKIFPFLKEMGEEVRYTKIFVQTIIAAVEQEFSDRRRTTKVGDLDLKKLFNQDEEPSKKYNEFFDLVKDETVTSIMMSLQELPRAIDGIATMANDKKKFAELNTEAILG